MGRADKRRMMRESLKKSQKLKDKYDQKVIIDRLSKNGISPEDLKTSFKEGYDEGLKVAVRPILKTCYGALCLLLHDEYGFDQQKCLDALKAFDYKVTYAISEDEYIGETFDKLGFSIEFNDATDRITGADTL